MALAVFQFSENTADPDLWGHIFFGQHLLKTGVLEKTEPFSWTATGSPWVNHETLSEVALGLSHLMLGGTGVLLLKILVGLLTFFLALKIATEEMRHNVRLFAWAFGALAVVEISYGFAARPQIFTAIFLAIQLWLLRRIHRGQIRWAFALPVLFVLWINTHGGALAGAVLLWIATVATSFHFFTGKLKPHPWLDEISQRKVVTTLWIASFISTAALTINPWGFGLIRWLIDSVLWLRPEIEEWNPTKLNWEHGTFFALIFFTVVSFIFSRRSRMLWEVAVCGALMFLAVRSVRHTPLFSIAALAFVPQHLANIYERFRLYFSQIEDSLEQQSVRRTALFVMIFGIFGMILATVFLHKERFWTMEVPRSQYPVAAMDFMKRTVPKGNLLIFFDWGEQALWELRDCRPSIDGRLDTCYPRKVISAHWKFYNAEKFDESILDVSKANLALLPVKLAGALELSKRAGWHALYYDEVAVFLVREPAPFSKLRGITPVAGEKSGTKGRAAFPNKSPVFYFFRGPISSP